MQEVVYVDSIEEYTNPATGKGWSPREEEIIAEIISKESVTRMEAIRRMRRRRLDDLKGKIRIVRASPIGSGTRFQGVRRTRKASAGGVGAINHDVRVNPVGETLDQYFGRPDTPQPGSPVGIVMVRILDKYPEMTFDAAREEAKRLLDKAAGRDHYHLPQVLGEEQKRAAAERLATIRKAA